MKIKISPRRLVGTVDAMPSKSHAHRLLLASKLAELQGSTAGKGTPMPIFSDDIEATSACLRQFDKKSPFLQCGESAATLRFLIPVVMAFKKSATFLGTGNLPNRTIDPLKDAMEQHGCSFKIHASKPSDKFRQICTISGSLTSGDYYIPGNISSQFITGLLFALPLLDGNSNLILTTELESSGYVEMTLDVLSRYGISMDINLTDEGFICYSIPGNQQYKEPSHIQIDADWSNAAMWLAAGALNGDITVKGLNPNTLQNDMGIVDIMTDMGSTLQVINHDDGTVDIRAKASTLNGITVDISQFPDLAPVLAVLMAFSGGSSAITHCERLAFKESNRIKSIYALLVSLGAEASYTDDQIHLTGKAFLNGGSVESYNDHRIAMAAAVSSCLCKDSVTITNPLSVTKSYPDFFKDFISLGGEVEYI